MNHVKVTLSAVACVCAALSSVGAARPLSDADVSRIRGYLAAQECPQPTIDKENYGTREGVPGPAYYYGWTLDPLEKMKGFKPIGHLPYRDMGDIGSRYLSAGLELENILGDDVVPYLKAAGFKRARLSYAWRNMERKKGVYDFSQTERMVRLLVAAGIEPWFYGGYGNELYYGDFALKDPLARKFWDAPCYHGDEAVKGWLAFLEALAAQFKGRIRFYEIWNELDARWYKGGDRAYKELGISQATRDFTAFYRDSIAALRRGNPSAVAGISLGSLDSPWAIGLARAGLPELLDVWTYHGYLRTPEEKVRMSLEQMRALYRRKDGTLPAVVMGECGWGAGPARSERLSTRTEYGQAKFFTRRLLFDKAMGAKFSSVFNVGSINYGLFRTDDKTPRLAYYVIRSLATLLDGLEPAPDLFVTFSTRTRMPMTPQGAWSAVECHSFRRKGVPLFAWWVPEHIDIEGDALFGKLSAQSGCDKADNLKHPVLIDTVRRVVWDLKDVVWAGSGVDVIPLVPAANYPYIMTDISVFDGYAGGKAD